MGNDKTKTSVVEGVDIHKEYNKYRKRAIFCYGMLVLCLILLYPAYHLMLIAGALFGFYGTSNHNIASGLKAAIDDQDNQ